MIYSSAKNWEHLFLPLILTLVENTVVIKEMNLPNPDVNYVKNKRNL